MLAIEYYNENKINKPCNLHYDDGQEIITYILNNISTNQDIIRCWFGHAIPTNKAIDKIKHFIEHDHCLEIGAGRGLWAFLIGNNIVTTDKFIPDYSYCPIIKMDADSAINHYSYCNVLLIIWPPCDNTASNSIKIFKGNKVIYIGEDKNGCTGDILFFDILEDCYNLVDTLDIPNIYNHNDKIYFYVKK